MMYGLANPLFLQSVLAGMLHKHSECSRLASYGYKVKCHC